MIAVIFELTPAPGRTQEYFDLAAGLAGELKAIDGFLSIERFESVSHPGRFVSLSFWRDEEAVRRWRNLEQHRAAQAKGRRGVFSAYRLRVAQVIRDYSLDERKEAPKDSLSFHKSFHG
jgi:heme-degrading monooxygenase HmoA